MYIPLNRMYNLAWPLLIFHVFKREYELQRYVNMRKTSKRNYDAEMEKRFVCQEKPCHRSRAFSPLREEAANASSKKVRTLGKRKSPSIFFELLSLLIC